MTVLSRIWPISWFIARAEWRRLDRQETLVATAEYETRYSDTERTVVHYARFLVDGHGVRFTRLESGPNSIDQHNGRFHGSYRRDAFFWVNHGDLPEHGRRVDNRPRGQLIVFDGGAA